MVEMLARLLSCPGSGAALAVLGLVLGCSSEDAGAGSTVGGAAGQNASGGSAASVSGGAGGTDTSSGGAIGGGASAVGGSPGGGSTGQGGSPTGGADASGGIAATTGGAMDGGAGAAPSGGSAGNPASGGTESGGAGASAGAGGSAGSPAGGSAGAASGGESPEIGGTLPADSLAVRFADAVLSRWPDPGNIDGGIPAFEYNRGIVLVGIQRVYEGTQDQRYLTYIQRFMDEFVDANGNVDRPSAHSFDTIQPAVLLPFLFQETGEAKYANAADRIRALYDSIPKNAEGGFWHKQQYPNEMWLDSMYMGQPFLAKYATIRDCGTFCTDTVVEQMTLIAEHVRDPDTGLLYHGWDEDRNASWADQATGRSPIIWGRAVGWYAMALVDLIPYLPDNGPGRAELLDILNDLASGLESVQDAGGLWHQVLDQGNRSDDFLETSASAMFVYALKLGSKRGYIAESYASVAEQGFSGLMGQIGNDANGPTINGAVQGMGIQVDYAQYVNKQRLTNSSHGLCGILLAAAAMESE